MTDELSVADCVAERLLSTMSFVAKDMKLWVELHPALVHAWHTGSAPRTAPSPPKTSATTPATTPATPAPGTA
jgi:hypothetical protein